MQTYAKGTSKLFVPHTVVLINLLKATMRAACCKRWFDCIQCHMDASDHELFRTMELIVACKACRKVFKKDLRYMPHFSAKMGIKLFL